MLKASPNNVFMQPPKPMTERMKPMGPPLEQNNKKAHSHSSNKEISNQEPQAKNATSSQVEKNNRNNTNPVENKDKKESFSNVMTQVVNETKLKEEGNKEVDLLNAQSFLVLNPSIKDNLPKELLSQLMDNEEMSLEDLQNLVGTNSELLVDSELKNSEELLLNPALLSQNKALIDADNQLIDEMDLSVKSNKKGLLNSSIENILKNQKLMDKALGNSKQLEGEDNKLSFGNEFKSKAELDKLSSELKQEALKAKLEPKFSDLINSKDKISANFSLNNFKSELGLNNTASVNNNFSQQIATNLSGSPLVPLTDHLPKDLNASAAQSKTFQIDTPVGQNSWSKQFNDQVVWMGTKDIKAASIRLTPIELGPVEINLKITNETASIQFNSHSPQVRELIEQALPKLREQLSEQGIELTDADVNDNSNQQSLNNQEGEGDDLAKNKENDFFSELKGDKNANETLVSEIKHKEPKGLIDYLV